MIRFLMGLLALVMASAALATAGSLIDDSWPPARFQGDRTVEVHFVSRPLDGKTSCGSWAPKYIINACSITNNGPIWLPNPCSSEFAGQSFARYACHEMAHVNGWPADHPR